VQQVGDAAGITEKTKRRNSAERAISSSKAALGTATASTGVTEIPSVL
jgi:hypothetical protein